ncbi:CLUMA_CG018846, isoform A [Clunio marinus]|uniref:CLUMA_CG018846, isoform A n=1 Tax=Clunio marinus TaxID=568069 RepID=A0A1J1IZX8_9DIPT|nr:CLUMA_CG018846, isoform A [Clunio marinus]
MIANCFHGRNFDASTQNEAELIPQTMIFLLLFYIASPPSNEVGLTYFCRRMKQKEDKKKRQSNKCLMKLYFFSEVRL